jgi:uncharacterized membrane protein
MSTSPLSVRKIVIAGVLSAITILLGWTRLGFITVPTIVADATIMHVPVIVGGVVEGPIVGAIVGLIFGIFSFIQGTIPAFKDPLVAILPRLFIGITAWLAYIALKRLNQYVAVVVAAVVGSLTNTVGVLGMGVVRGYWPAGPAVAVGVAQGIPEAILAAIITTAVVVVWKRIDTGQAEAKM